MDCRLGCGACCIAPSISSPIPGMADGKPAGVRCVQLDDNNLCRIFGQPERPAACLAFQPARWICGDRNSQALERIALLERDTAED
ncbi:YkgJ family cysteine cluster protein [Motiliproteus sp.]|uniref:YkgJ family cysteine cluster protein n=1 Tax=Motiliproteus sp. TaxID=1898955 RepID=UPI003BAADC79